MKTKITIILLIMCAVNALGVEYNRYFTDQSLRIDFSVSGRGNDCVIDIDTVVTWPRWYGRKVNLTKELYPESVQIVIIDAGTADTIYIDSKSSNVLAEDDTTQVARLQMLLPKPKYDSKIMVNIFGYDRDQRTLLQRRELAYTASELATLPVAADSKVDYRTLRQAADPDKCINIAIVAEGYTADEADKFYYKAQRLDSALFRQPAFVNNAKDFNVVAVMLPSPESGITIPSANKNVNSALGAHYDSFGLERLVIIEDSEALYNALPGIPAGQIIILANSDKYGGSGSYNEYAISSDGFPGFEEVVIHEFGHSFAWLADEYESGYDQIYSADREPMEPNITTMYDFTGKWQNLINAGVAGLVEGGGYQSTGIWRGCEHCLMRAIEDHDFCPVCAQAIERIIKYHIGD